MASSAFTRFEAFTENLAKGEFDFASDSFKVALTNTLPDSASDSVLSDLTEISTSGGGYTSGGYAVTSAVSRSGYITKIALTDLTITATGSPMATWRYAVVYDVGSSKLIGYLDYGSGGVTLDTDETITIDFDGTAGALTIS